MNKRQRSTTVEPSQSDKPSPAAEVAKSAFEHVADLGDQLWTTILDRVPLDVTNLLIAYEDLQATLFELNFKPGQPLAPAAYASLRRVEQSAVQCLA